MMVKNTSAGVQVFSTLDGKKDSLRVGEARDLNIDPKQPRNRIRAQMGVIDIEGFDPNESTEEVDRSTTRRRREKGEQT